MTEEKENPMPQPEPATDGELIAKMEKLASQEAKVFVADAYRRCARMLRERAQLVAQQQGG